MIFICSILSILFAWLTFYLIKRPEMTPTRASSSLSLLGFLVLFGVNQLYDFDLNYFSALIFGASFVGMCSHKVVGDLQVIIAAIVFAIIFVLCEPSSYGVGGALGFSAFISILPVWALNFVIHRRSR